MTDIHTILRPGPHDLIQEVAAHLDGACTSHSPRLRHERLAVIEGEYRAHQDAHYSMDPRTASALLLALRDKRVRDLVLPWHDEAAWRLWADLVHHAPATWVAPVATLIATTAFQQGHPDEAAIAAAHALKDDPAYTLARYVQRLLEHQIHPAEFSHVVAQALAGDAPARSSDPDEPLGGPAGAEPNQGRALAPRGRLDGSGGVPRQMGERTPRRARDARDARDKMHPDHDGAIVLSRPSELIIALPYLMGFRPQEGDVVVVALQERRVHFMASAVTTSADEIAKFWAEMQQRTRSQPITSLMLVAYTPASTLPVLRSILRQAGPRLSQALRVHEGQWWDLFDPDRHDPDHCGPDCECGPGHPVPDEPHELVEHLRAETQIGELGDRDGLGDFLQPGPPEGLEQVQSHLDRLDATVPVPDDAQLLAAVRQELDARTARPCELQPERAALLLFALRRPHVRLRCCARHDEAAWWLWTELIGWAPAGWVAPVAGLLATTSYQRSNTNLTRVAAERALADDPTFAWARLVLHQLFDEAVEPQAFAEALAGAVALLGEPPRAG